MNEKILLEYIWLDGGSPQQLRSKVKIVDVKDLQEETSENFIEKLPQWNFDGSSTGQSKGSKSDLLLQPVKAIFHPFYTAGYAVLCEVLNVDGTPHETNTRHTLKEVATTYQEFESLFGIEQEYVLVDLRTKLPLGMKEDFGNTKPQGDYYCGTGSGNVFGRQVSEEHMNTCLTLGLEVCGTNAEVLCGQWEYQLGPLTPVEISDQLWLSRWLLLRISEKYGVGVTFDPKPVSGDWNGSGGHTNYSNKYMRAPGGLSQIQEACKLLEKNHKKHIESYGEGNARRLTGKHETCNIEQFRVGDLDRGASVRVPLNVLLEGKGYLEDRRPAANMDPYTVCKLMLDTICG